ncbi:MULTISPECIES: hypothetical protein [Mycoplasma]|uniref:Transcriptional regulator n=1 Tax=Mycoplasma zalophidermidis TaxID=398174 RepID=A0ABS6DRP4_9MOLU|nr:MULTISPECIES: hypothetical protein [Mycoplasma]MBU4693683.1 hypothetical protein [Mycoplasma zalophidermidis]MCR8966561.1 hypothetical protein [Mycoplasma zalophidermidis]MCS4537166.1 hypothetical protein [Mycoplasma sp. CSL7475-4]MCT4470044.1 hypothetical protein [Mycoplasma sp. HS2188]
MPEKKHVVYDHEEYMRCLKEDIARDYGLSMEEFNLLDDFSPEAKKLYDDLIEKVHAKIKSK